VNVALPTLVRELDAGTRELQWIVDAYTLTFAALVLACGAVSDRYGRREALVLGLVIYGTGNLLASPTGATALIVTRAVMGVGAAGAGLRLMPVATFVALMSVVGTKLAVRIGNKLVISTGLGLLGRRTRGSPR
jgi:MFS family permease